MENASTDEVEVKSEQLTEIVKEDENVVDAIGGVESCSEVKEVVELHSEVKTELKEDSEVDAKLKENIKRQIEFYFSDSNFRKDKFLKAQAQLDANGYVPISVLLTFNRLKALTTDVSLIVEVMKESEVVDVSEDGLKLKRNAELPANDDSMVKTLYVKGYPTDDPDVTIESVISQFSAYGKVNLVHLRKIKLTKAFKGSCFIEFENESSVADAVAAAHEEGSTTDVRIGYKGMKFLCVLPYVEWRKRHDVKLEKRFPTEKSSSGRSADVKLGKRDSSEISKDESSSAAAVAVKVEFISGLILHITNIPTDADVYEIKDFFKNIAEIKFVDYNSGSSEAYVRTADLNASTKVQEHLKTNPQSLRAVEGSSSQSPLGFYILTGSEEQAYWEKIMSNAKPVSSRGGGRGGRGGGRGGRGGGRSFKRGRKG